MQDSDGRKKTVIKLTIAGILLVFAGVLTLRGCSGAGKLSAETHRSPYVCSECGYSAYYTKAEREKLLEETGSGQSEMTCPKCNKLSMKTAIKCKNCGKIYPLVMTFAEGGMKMGQCPDCGELPQ